MENNPYKQIMNDPLGYIMCNWFSETDFQIVRSHALTNEFEGNIVVDTCSAIDTGKWETGIEQNNHWTIVEQYEDEYAAKIGHEKWCYRAKENPFYQFIDIYEEDIKNSQE